MFKKKKFYYKENKRSGIEIKVSKYLKDNDIKFLYNARFSDCKNPYTGQELMFDFWLYEKNIIIETDGPQHSKYVKEFDGKDKTKYLKIITALILLCNFCFSQEEEKQSKLSIGVHAAPTGATFIGNYMNSSRSDVKLRPRLGFIAGINFQSVISPFNNIT